MSIVKKVWHISNTDKTIDSFIPSNKGIFGPGIYTTTNFEKIKKHYFDSKSKRHKGRVYELEVTLNNPIEGNDGIMKDGTPYHKLLQAYAAEYGGEEGSIQAMEYAKKMGHDGVIRSSTDGTEIILPFDNKSIKILNNNVNMEQHMENKQDLTEKDFVFNGRKDWRLFKEAISQKMLLDAAEKLKGGMADNKTLEDIAKKHNVSLEDIKKEFEAGLKVEKEHTTDEKVATEIAKDHLFEDPKYYTKLDAAKLEEAKKRKVGIAPDPSRAAPAQGSAQLAAQASGPGTTSPAVMEESKKQDLKQIKGVGSGLDRAGNKHMPPAKKVEGDKRSKLMKKAERYDESENRSKFFKDAWKTLNEGK